MANRAIRAPQTKAALLIDDKGAGISRTAGVANYPAAPTRIGCEVGAGDPPVGSMVMANALASTPLGSVGLTIVAAPRASGWNTPAGMGDPLEGISHNSYTLPAVKGAKL